MNRETAALIEATEQILARRQQLRTALLHRFAEHHNTIDENETLEVLVNDGYELSEVLEAVNELGAHRECRDGRYTWTYDPEDLDSGEWLVHEVT